MEMINDHMFGHITRNEILLMVVYSITIIIGISLLICLKKKKERATVYLKEVMAFVLILSIVFTLAVEVNYYNARIYNSAIEDINNGDYISAMSTLEYLGGYYNSLDMMEKIYQQYRYQLGIQYEENEDWIHAMTCFIDSYYYSNSSEHLKYCSEKYIKELEEKY